MKTNRSVCRAVGLASLAAGMGLLPTVSAGDDRLAIKQNPNGDVEPRFAFVPETQNEPWDLIR